jgi:hypothetical protein
MRCIKIAGRADGAGDDAAARIMRQVRAKGLRQHLKQYVEYNIREGDEVGREGVKGVTDMRAAVPKVEFETRAQ